jgi:hypothetical protein
MGTFLLAGLLIAKLGTNTPYDQMQACINHLREGVAGVEDIHVIGPGLFTYTVPDASGQRVRKTHSCFHEGTF